MFDDIENSNSNQNNSDQSQSIDSTKQSSSIEPRLKKKEIIDVNGVKEPEDIFSDIKDPVLPNETNNDLENMSVMQQPQSTSLIKKILLAILIFIIILSVGLGGWYIFNHYFNQNKDSSDEIVNKAKPQPIIEKSAHQKIANLENVEEVKPKIPVPEVDKKKQIEDQLVLNLLKNKERQNTENNAVSNSTTSANTSTEATLEKELKTKPKNIPLPIIKQKATPGEDNDQDGLSNFEEHLLGTDPDNKDTDGDGYNDYQELKAGYDPLQPLKN